MIRLHAKCNAANPFFFGLAVSAMLMACEPRRSEPSLPPSKSLAPRMVRVALTDTHALQKSTLAQAQPARWSAPPVSPKE